jgi:peroxiredoxin
MTPARLLRVAIVGVSLVASPLAIAAPMLADPVLAPDAALPTDAETAAKQAVRAGKPAPRATFKNAEGKEIELAELIEDGPVVLIFYRGGWCPFCVEQLKAFNNELSAIKSAGGRVIAVSTELPEHAAKTKRKSKLGFDVLSDPGAKAARAFGVAWANARYGPGLEKYQGNAKGEIPLGVTYVIDTDGTVRWAYLEHDYKKRATPEQAIEALNGIE